MDIQSKTIIMKGGKKMDQERMIQLGELLNEDASFTEEILQKTPEEAVKVLEEKGYSFSVEELVAFGEALVSVCKGTGELDATELEDVTGGAINWRKVVGQTCITVGTTILGAAVTAIW